MCKNIVLGSLLLLFAYGVVQVRLGDFTFPQHVMRIARTDAVRDLGSAVLRELSDAQRDLKRTLREKLEESSAAR